MMLWEELFLCQVDVIYDGWGALNVSVEAIFCAKCHSEHHIVVNTYYTYFSLHNIVR